MTKNQAIVENARGYLPSGVLIEYVSCGVVLQNCERDNSRDAVWNLKILNREGDLKNAFLIIKKLGDPGRIGFEDENLAKELFRESNGNLEFNVLTLGEAICERSPFGLLRCIRPEDNRIEYAFYSLF